MGVAQRCATGKLGRLVSQSKGFQAYCGSCQLHMMLYIQSRLGFDFGFAATAVWPACTVQVMLMYTVGSELGLWLGLLDLFASKQ